MVQNLLKSVSAFSPCNITGFFRICDGSQDPLRVGSTGASVSLALGLTTHVRLRRTRKTRVRVALNGRSLDTRSVSQFVVSKYVEFLRGAWRIDITHECRLPVGCGFGTSGAGALSLSLALNEGMGSPFSRSEAARFAHIAEIVCKTGLGTVSSVFSGGMTLRTAPGAPGVGRVSKFRLPGSVNIATASFGPISTRRVLGNNPLKNRINLCSRKLLSRFNRTRPQASFMKISRTFSDCLGLMSRRLGHLVNELDSIGFGSSMAMLGESMFCMIAEDQVATVAAIIRKHGLTPMISRVAASGAHVL